MDHQCLLFDGVNSTGKKSKLQRWIKDILLQSIRELCKACN